jgi:hypothetical protein
LLLAFVLAMPFLSGCILTSQQVVLVVPPTATAEFFSFGVRTLLYDFDLATAPEWVKHHGKLSDVTELTIMGSFTFPLSGQGVGPTLTVTIGETPGLAPTPGSETPVWGPLKIEYPQTERVDWQRGMKLFGANARLVRSEIMGDGRFGLVVTSAFSNPMTGGVDVPDFHLGAVMQVRRATRHRRARPRRQPPRPQPSRTARAGPRSRGSRSRRCSR